MDSGIGTLWLLVATFLVLLMQSGFLLLEGGRVRSKNSINVAQKNITDLVVVWVCYLCVGFYVMYGYSALGLSGVSDATGAPTLLEFVYQFGFACTTATILSGAISERVSFRAYLVLVVVIATVCYPLAGRLVWGDSFNADTTALLADLGFVDFAGSTVVHGVGAWFGLTALIMIGPRLGRFNDKGEPQVLPAHNAVIALCGVLILMLGWLGFNGGTVSPSDPLLQSIIFHTFSAAAFGALAGMAVGVYLDKGIFNPSRVTTGLLGGLVACSASVNMMNGAESVVVGLLGGCAATYGAHMLLHRFKLDDPLDVVATHGGAGVVGTLAVAFVIPQAALPAGGIVAQLAVQLLGIVAVAVLSCASCWIAVTVLKRFMDYRVSEQAEKIGLNYTEHGESVGLARLQMALESQSDNAGSFASALQVDADDEHSELAATLNTLVGKYEKANDTIVTANRRFQQFAETASDWLWETDAELLITFIHANSDHAEQDVLEQVHGINLFDKLQMEDSVRQQIEKALKNRVGTPVFEAILSLPDAKIVTRSVEMRGVPFTDSQGQFAGYRGTLTDISVRKSAESRALFLSLHDELTGLPNRRALARSLTELLQKTGACGSATVIAGVDLDGFKAVNDAYGHLVGDDLLKQVACRLERFLRPEDTAYRTGGDEFVVVLTDLDKRCAGRVARTVMQRLIDELSELYYVQTLDIKVGASVGISVYPEHADSVEDMLRMADLALYAAKDQGKGCVVCFEPDMDIDAKLQLKIEGDLHKAIADNEFYLDYQPQVDTMSNRIVGFEALVRWEHPERGEIPPGDFIAVAEKLNLMDQIGTFVLDEACAFATTWPTPPGGTPYKIGVNVSPQQFRNPDFCQVVRDTLSRHGLPPERLEIEITEDVLVHDFGEVSGLLLELRTMGVAVAVDDFGSGQTSLRYLNQFPISTIKIDRSFIKHLASDDKAAEITQTIVALGHRLGVSVLAEGVEEASQLSMLKQWSVDQIQGFFFSRPLSVDDVMKSVSSGTLDSQDKKSA